MEVVFTLLDKISGWLYHRFWRWRELRGFYKRAIKKAKGDRALKQEALEIVRSDFFSDFIRKRTVPPEEEFSEFYKRLKGKCPEADDSTIAEFLKDVYDNLADLMEGRPIWDKRGDEIAEFLRQRRQPAEKPAFEKVLQQRTYSSHFTYIPKPSNFLDREDELEKLNEWLKNEEQSVGALVGVGGQGKTYLAAKFAEECQGNGWQVRWAESPFTVEQFLLSIASEMQNYGDQYASVVGDPQRPLNIRFDNAVRFLESQPQPWLVVLDDFHKANEEEWRETIAFFDQSCRKTKILLTARREPEAFEEVKLPTGAHEILDVPKLPKEVAKEYLEALGLRVNEEMAGRIWEKCSGNPVAMKLFAQAARRRSAKQLLKIPLPDWSTKAQEWMDELLSDLSEPAKEAAKQLSIFDEPAEHDLLLAIGAIEDSLFELQDYRLAERTIDERWQEHDLLRQYWRAKLREEEKANWHRLAGEWLKGQAEKIKAGQREHKVDDWSLELQQTWASYLRRAFWQFASAEATQGALEAASPITKLLCRWGEWDENLRLCKKALELARKSGDEATIAEWAHWLAMRHYERGDLDVAERLYLESLEIKERLSNLQGKSVTLHWLGMLAYDRGDYEGAERLYRESLEISERLGYLEGKAENLLQLGMLAHDRGNYEEAERLYRESLEISERLGYLEGKSISLHELGRLAHNRGDYEGAERLYHESLEIDKRLGDLQGKSATLHRLGVLAHNRGNYEEAERLYLESLEIDERLGDLQGKSISLHRLGMLAHDRGDYKGAERLYRESLEISERLGYLEGKAETLWKLGLLRKKQGRKDEAKDLLMLALEIYERMGHRYAKDVQSDLEALGKGE
jgi:tetratricopeptide (TPR) repeat protein